MTKYELTIVLDGAATAAQKKAKTEFVEKLVNVSKGKIVKKEDWGTRDLFYKINKSETGAFLYFEIELSSDMVNSFETKVRLEDGIIRHLLVKAEE